MATRKSQRHSHTFAYLLLGADAYLRDEQRNAIIGENVPAEARDFGVAKFSLESARLSEILAHAETRPMLGERQVLVVEDADRLREDDLEQLKNYLEAPADFSILVFEAEDLDGRTRAAKFLLDNCEVFKAKTSGENHAVQMANQFARELGIELAPATTDELVMVLGNDLGRLRAELAKLRAYVGPGGHVTPKEVADVVVPARKFGVFDLVEPLAEHRRGDALRLLRKLMEKGERPEMIVGALAWLYRQLLLAHMLGPQARWALRAPRDRVELLLRQAPRFTPEELHRAFGALLEADVALKSSPPDAALILEVLVTKLAGGRHALAPK